VHGLDQALMPSIRSALQRGDLQFALNAIAATSQVDRIRQIASKLAGVVGTTKVKVLDDISPVAGRKAAGMFDPETNTIFIDTANGMNVHTIMHEMTHAATSAAIQNLSLPQTKQLQTILNAAREQFGEVYGTANLAEFIAEAFSNPEFQSALAMTKVDNGNTSGWDKFTSAVRNIVRKLMGLQPKAIESSLDKVDRIINGQPHARLLRCYWLHLPPRVVLISLRALLMRYPQASGKSTWSGQVILSTIQASLSYEGRRTLSLVRWIPVSWLILQRKRYRLRQS
jgi:hypothetical protein